VPEARHGLARDIDPGDFVNQEVGTHGVGSALHVFKEMKARNPKMTKPSNKIAAIITAERVDTVSGSRI
jgi:hypothetical protein